MVFFFSTSLSFYFKNDKLVILQCFDDDAVIFVRGRRNANRDAKFSEQVLVLENLFIPENEEKKNKKVIASRICFSRGQNFSYKRFDDRSSPAQLQFESRNGKLTREIRKPTKKVL